METQELNNLIDQYLLDTIGSEDKERLEQLAAADPEVSRQLQESQRAFAAIRLARDRQLREQMIQWDRQSQGGQRVWNSKLWWMIGSALILALCIYLAGLQFAPSHIGQRNLIPYTEMETQWTGQSTPPVQWQEAEKTFRNNQYEKAILLYSTVADSGTTSHNYTVQWNILMARLALEGPTEQWLLAMDSLAAELPQAMARKAERMTGWLRSRYYRMIYLPQQPALAPLRPRLI
mgnify:FL=1